MTSCPCIDAGTKGNGGAGITLPMIDSSSGAASAISITPAMTSSVAGNSNTPPRTSVHGLKLIAEARHHAEVAAAAPDRPEQLGVRRRVHMEDLAVRRDDLGRENVIDRQTVLSDQVSDATAERDAADTHRSCVSKSGRQAVHACSRGVLGGTQARFRPRGAADRIDVERLQVAQIKDDATLDGAVTRAAVAAAANRQCDAGFPRQQ